MLIFIPAVVPGSTLVVSGGHGRTGGGGCFDRGDRSGCSRTGSRGHHHHHHHHHPPAAAADDAAVAAVVGVAMCVGG